MPRLWFILIIVCAACSGATTPATVESDENGSRPSWLTSIGATVIAPQEKICIEISQGELWQPEIDPNTLSQHLENSLRIVVGEVAIPRAEMDIAVPDLLTPVFDDSGKKIGSYGGNITACFPSPVEVGAHMAMVEVSPRQGVVLSYSWEFTVEA